MIDDLEFDRGLRDRALDQEADSKKVVIRLIHASRAAFTGTEEVAPDAAPEVTSASEEPQLKIAFLKEMKEKARKGGIITADDFATQIEGKNISQSRAATLFRRTKVTLEGIQRCNADSIQQLDLPTETLNALEQACIQTISELENSKADLSARALLSEKRVTEIHSQLTQFKSGLNLAI